MRKIISAFLFTCLSFAGIAQQIKPANSARIYNELAQLKHLTSVLYFAAHPDDENTRLLAWLVNDKHIRTAYMSLTRGDGGQNILGSEQGPALGFIRTHELIEARKIDGAEQFFSRAVDFGFSKTYQETFRHWNEYQLTNDAVWVMRKFRPDVVICRFPPNTLAGHGQHAASAIIAAKAFKLAGDKLQYTEQLHYYKAWQPKRLLWNTYNFGSRNTTSPDQFKQLVGQYIPAAGMGSGELAGLSRSVHKSQGAGTPSTPGTQMEYFKLTDGDTLINSLFDGIDITWGRVNRKDIGEDINAVISDYNPLHPDYSLPALLAIRKKIETVKDDFWRKQKLKETDQIILDCTGFLAELFTKQPQAVAGNTLPFTLHVIARSHTAVKLASVKWMAGQDVDMNVNITGDTLLSFEHTITIPANTPVTEPYWLSQPSTDPGVFTIPEDSLLGLPEAPDNLNATVTLKIGDEKLDVAIPLSYKKLDPVKGDLVEPLRVVPGATVAFTNNLAIAQPDGSILTEVRLHAFQNINDRSLNIKDDQLRNIKTVNHLHISQGTDTVLSILIPGKELSEKSDYYISASLKDNGQVFDKTQHLIQYNHLPTLQYFSDPYIKVLKANWKCTVKHIGYVEGAGDYVPAILRAAGLQVDVLKESDFTNAEKLKKYDAIIVGIRAVNVEKRMSYWMPVLLQYAQNGGTLVMQYNTLQDMSTTQLGPYPITLSDKRVTEEDAAITFINPQSRLLNYPNKIIEADFTSWVQERGLYFPVKWDDHYQPVFSMHDAGEDALTGSTLYTKYGKGNYIYTSLSFFRQLPVGNKGAIRLLMNMLSVGK